MRVGGQVPICRRAPRRLPKESSGRLTPVAGALPPLWPSSAGRGRPGRPASTGRSAGRRQARVSRRTGMSRIPLFYSRQPTKEGSCALCRAQVSRHRDSLLRRRLLPRPVAQRGGQRALVAAMRGRSRQRVLPRAGTVGPLTQRTGPCRKPPSGGGGSSYLAGVQRACHAPVCLVIARSLQNTEKSCKRTHAG